MKVSSVSSGIVKSDNPMPQEPQASFKAQLVIKEAADKFVRNDIYIKSGLKLKNAIPMHIKFENLCKELQKRIIPLGRSNSEIAIDVNPKIYDYQEGPFGRVVEGLDKTLRLLIPINEDTSVQHFFDYREDNELLLKEFCNLTEKYCK